MAHLCIVGAGAAGAGAADALRETDHDVTLLEKSRGVGGRAATRRRNGCRYDHGANYVNPDDDGRTADLLRELGTEGLTEVAGPVWTFDADGAVEPGDAPDADKWTWEAGITQLAKRLLARTDAEVRKTTRVASLREDDTGMWTVTDTEGGDHGPFDAVLLTPPAPQTAELLGATTADSLSDGTLRAAREAVANVPYRTIRTLILHYDEPLERPYYALVDTSKEHPIGWVSREECKPGHVPDGESLLVVQMSPEWSTAHYDEPLEDAAAIAADHVAALLDDDRLRNPDWVDDQGWRYALPDAAVDGEPLSSLADAGLHVAGDWVAGEARVHAALWNGIETGERLAKLAAE